MKFTDKHQNIDKITQLFLKQARFVIFLQSGLLRKTKIYGFIHSKAYQVIFEKLQAVVNEILIF